MSGLIAIIIHDGGLDNLIYGMVAVFTEAAVSPDLTSIELAPF